MSFDDLVDAVRATDGEAPELVDATHRRVVRTLETRARSRHQLAGLLTAVGILFGGTVSWALATGHVAALWAPAPAPVTEPPPAPAPPPPPVKKRPSPPRTPAIVTVPVPPPAPETVPPPPPEPPPPPPRAPKPAPRVEPPPQPQPPPPAPPAPPAPIEALYRKAHDLHFHGGAPAATLAAWDAYLAAEPAGRFSVDARYNRALILIRLGRYAEARAALEPFARGQVEPEGYHQAEAAQLVERLARFE